MKRLRGRRIVPLLLVLIMAVSMLTPVSSHAYDGIFLQVTISSSPYQYVGLTVHDSSLFEGNMMEKKLYDRDREMVLTWAEMKDKLTTQDSKRSTLAKTSLLPSLNEALRFINGGKVFTDKLAFNEASNALKSQNGSYNGYTFAKGNQTDQEAYLMIRGLEAENYITITAPGGEKRVFAYSMPKYIETDEPAGGNRDGVVSWDHLIDSAQKYEEDGITSSNAMSVHEKSMLGEQISWLISNIVNGLENILGLESVNELIFNQGIRGNSDLYVYGVFPTGWNPYINLMFTVFQVIAWATILLSVINLIFRKSLSTISRVRAEVMLEIQQLIFAGLLLVFIFPAFAVFFKGSFLLTNVFANAMDPTVRDEFFINLPMYGSTLAGFLVSIAYFVITLYFNVFYIVRAVLAALFIAISPLFIVFMTLGKGARGIFMTWFKHVVAGIVIQPIHAFVLGFLMLLPYGMSGIQAVVFCATLIPLSETIRNIIVGNAGGKMDGMADNLVKWGAGVTVTAAHVAGKGADKAKKTYGNQVKKDRDARTAKMREYDLDERKKTSDVHREESQKQIAMSKKEYDSAQSAYRNLKGSGASDEQLSRVKSGVEEKRQRYEETVKNHSGVINSSNRFDELYGKQKAGLQRDRKRAERMSAYKAKESFDNLLKGKDTGRRPDGFNRPFKK